VIEEAPGDGGLFIFSCEDAQVIRRALAFAYAVLIRTLGAVGGAIAAYGATGMFTTGGISPPNAIVNVGVLAIGLVAVALWSKERRLEGLWPALLIIAVPYALYAFGSWSIAECPPNPPPQTPEFSCAPVGTHAIGIVAPILALCGLALFVRDIRALARRVTSVA
jgi:hypothetical protein